MTDSPRQWNSTLPQRTKRLQPSKPLREVGSVERRLGSGKARLSPVGALTSRRSTSATIPPRVRQAVLERAQSRCEACGLAFNAPVLHHRRLDGQGGGETEQNLIAIHQTPCHHLIHNLMPRWVACSHGLLIDARYPAVPTPVVCVELRHPAANTVAFWREMFA